MQVQIRTLLSGDDAGFLLALLTGRKGELSAQADVDLSEAGVYHILAVSGMHCAYLLALVAVSYTHLSFEKITDANAALSPEMKSTGEVLGLGKNMQEALFKGLVSAGYKVEKATRGGVLISVNHRDQPEIVNIARKLDEMGYKLYATDGTASEISDVYKRQAMWSGNTAMRPPISARTAIWIPS